jgi:predicted TIM-barrel fold metal-dependent hydrolase
LVVAHAVWPGTDFWMAVAERHANVYLDVSFFSEKPGVSARLAESADGVVGGKLIWGSGFPMKPLDSYRKFALAGFTDEQFGKITRDNALRALGRMA